MHQTALADLQVVVGVTYVNLAHGPTTHGRTNLAIWIFCAGLRWTPSTARTFPTPCMFLPGYGYFRDGLRLPGAGRTGQLLPSQINARLIFVFE